MATFDERFALPTQLPELEDSRLFKDFQVTPGTKIGNKLFGEGGEERFQTWPERMVRSGLALPADVYEGREAIIDPTTGHTAQPIIERTQDLAGLAGMSSIPLAEKGALGAIGGKFYSTLENTIAGSKVQKATPEQWASYLKNQPGVKPEELEFSLHGLGDKVLTKEQLAQHVVDNGIKFGEVHLGEMKFDKASPYAIPEVIKAAKEAGSHPGDLELTLANDGKAYEALMKKFPSLRENEDWASVVSNSVFGGDTMPKGTTKYSSYQLPGGENYRELLMTVPEKKRITYDGELQKLEEKYGANWNRKASPEEISALENIKETLANVNYKSSHWDEPNVLAHIRMNDREVPGVGKTLHVEEIQSDWHQAGRKGGYKGQNLTAEDHAIRDRIRNNKATVEDNLAWENGVGDKFAKDSDSNLVPNAPFKKTWDELALKRVLSEAATKGYDAVSWTPGEAQAARYDLSKQVDSIGWEPITNSKSMVSIKAKNWLNNLHFDNEGKIVASFPTDGSQQFVGKHLSDVVGKDMAEKILSEKKGDLSGDGLKVGGEGMKAFYDTMLPAKANALIKKMGGKVEYHEMDTRPPNGSGGGEKRAKIPIIKITPQMRETIANKGFPLYSSGVPTFTPVSDDPFKRKPRLVKVDHNPFENTE